MAAGPRLHCTPAASAPLLPSRSSQPAAPTPPEPPRLPLPSSPPVHSTLLLLPATCLPPCLTPSLTSLPERRDDPLLADKRALWDVPPPPPEVDLDTEMDRWVGGGEWWWRMAVVLLLQLHLLCFGRRYIRCAEPVAPAVT